MHPISSFETEPDEPATRLLYSRGRSPPCLLEWTGKQDRSKGRSAEASTASKQGWAQRTGGRQAGISGQTGAGEQAAKQGPARAAQLARASRTAARARHTPLTPLRARPARKPRPAAQHAPGARAHTPLGPAPRTYPATRRAHRGPRTAAASCQTWSRPALPGAGGGQSCGPAADTPDSRAWLRGWRRLLPNRGQTGARRRSDSQQWRPGPPPLATPATLGRGRGRGTRLPAATTLAPQALLGRPSPAPAARPQDPSALSNRRGVGTPL